MDEHPLRGIYDHSDLTYFVKKPIRLQPGQADALTMGVSDDPFFLRGTDPVSGTATTDYGNYGVIYHVIYTLGEATERQPVVVSLNPWGGNFSGAALAAGPSGMEVLDIPPTSLVFSEQDKRETIQTFGHGYTTQEFLWSPPGASNLPLRLFWTREEARPSRTAKGTGKIGERGTRIRWKLPRRAACASSTNAGKQAGTGERKTLLAKKLLNENLSMNCEKAAGTRLFLRPDFTIRTLSAR